MTNIPNFNKIPNKGINFNQKAFYEDNFGKVKVFAEEVDISLNDKQAQIDVLVVNGDSSPAADQARVDANGVLKTSLKTRLDDDYNVVNAQFAETAKQVDLDQTDNDVSAINLRVDGLVIGSGSTLTQATESILGGIKAKTKTTETGEVAIDTSTGKLYVVDKPSCEVTVGKDNSDYTTIGAALAYGRTLAPKKVNILISNGVYEEIIDMRNNNNVSLIAENNRECTLINKSGNYVNSPLILSGDNYIKNLRVIANHENNPSVTAPYSYAVHYDYEGVGLTIFEDCIFESYQNAAVGIGLHQDQTLKFINCQLISDSPLYNGGSLYFHNAVASGVSGQELIIERCNIYSKTGHAIKADDANIGSGNGLGNDMTVTFIDNSIYSDVYGETPSKNTIAIGEGTYVGNIKLGAKSSWNKALKASNEGTNGQVLTAKGNKSYMFENPSSGEAVGKFIATIGTTWIGSTPPYSQNIVLAGIKSEDAPLVDILMSGVYVDDVSIGNEWAKIYRIATFTDLITVYASAKTVISVPIQLLVVK